MDSKLIIMFRHSIIIKGILVFLFALYIVVFLLIIQLPQGTKLIPAHMVEDGAVFSQPVEIIVIDPYMITNNGLGIDRYQIQTQGVYSFQLYSTDDITGPYEVINFRVFIYDYQTAQFILVFSLVPLALFFFSLKRGYHESV